MASRSQILADNQTSFPNNNSALITPQVLRDFNSDFANSVVFNDQTGSMTINTGSFATTGSNTFTGIQTYNNQTVFNAVANFSAPVFVGNQLIFTASRFSPTVANSADLEMLDQNRFGFNIKDKNASTSGSDFTATVNSGSLFASVDFNTYYGGNIGILRLRNNNGSRSLFIDVDTSIISGSTTFVGPLIGNLNGTASFATTASFALNAGGATVNTGSLLTTASVSLNTITFTKGDASTFAITVDTGSGGTISTGSFATTGSNTFIGSQTITGSIDATGNIVALGSLRSDQFNTFTGSQLINGSTFQTGSISLFGGVSATGNIIATGSLRSNNGNTFTGSQNINGNTFQTGSINITNEINAAGNGIFGGSIFATGSISTNGSVVANGNIIATGSLRSNGGNTFFGSQNITGSTFQSGSTFQTGSITVTGNIIAGGSLRSGQFNTFTGSQNISGSTFQAGDIQLGGIAYINQSGLLGAGESILLGYSGSLVVGASANNATYSGLSHISASSPTNANLIFKSNSNTASTIVSGSGNIFTNAAAATAGFTRYIGGSGNIALSSVPQISQSMAFSPTMNNNYLAGTITLRGPVSSSVVYNINSNSILGTILLGDSGTGNLANVTRGLTFTGNSINGNLQLSGPAIPLASAISITNTNINGTAFYLAYSSSITAANNSINDSSANIINGYFSGSAGTGSLTFSGNTLTGTSNNATITGSIPAGGTGNPIISLNTMTGGNNTIFINATNSASGSTPRFSAIRNVIGGNNLVVTGSSSNSDLKTAGSAFFGRYNLNDGILNTTSDTVFAVGTGTATTARRTSLHVSSSGLTSIRDGLNITGSVDVTGSLTVGTTTPELRVLTTGVTLGNVVTDTHTVTGSLSISGSTTMTGNLSIAPTFEVRFATGSNQQAGTAVLDGANPGTVTVSNSLVTANSIIMVSKQTLAHTNGYVAVSSKGAGTFTITSNHNGDTDTVGWFVINNS